MAVQRPGESLVRGEVYIDNSTTPANAPFHMTPSAAPTNPAAGNQYHDSTLLLPRYYSGVAWERPTARVLTKTGGGTLTESDSGGTCFFNLTTVLTYTLPAAAAGLNFRFVCLATAAGTADIFRVVCASGDFFLGAFIQSTDGTYVTAAHAANGTTHLAWEGNGSTSGGLAGDWLDVWAISGTQWAVRGFGRATGSEGSPWKTS